MSKKLSEMTLEELWKLFPIFLVPHCDYWNNWFNTEKTKLEKLIPNGTLINHIGSTAIKNIWAKPIIDVLVEVPPETPLSDIKNLLCRNGYLLMSESSNRMSFNKGYTEHGFEEKVFHLHLRYFGDNDEIYFCEYLKRNPETAREYETLKLSLWKKFEHDRNGYTEAKSEFIKRYTKIALQEFSHVQAYNFPAKSQSDKN